MGINCRQRMPSGTRRIRYITILRKALNGTRTRAVYVYTDTTTPVDFSAAEEIPMGENEGKYFSNNDLIGWGGPLTSSMRVVDENDPNTAGGCSRNGNRL